jgi:hypothetical protein
MAWRRGFRKTALGFDMMTHLSDLGATRSLLDTNFMGRFIDFFCHFTGVVSYLGWIGDLYEKSIAEYNRLEKKEVALA